MARPKLTDEHRKRIVCALAAFGTPAGVAKLVKQEFGIDVSRQSVESYDPHSWAGRKLSDKWKTLFAEARAAHLRDAAEIGIAHRVERLRRLDRLYGRAEDSGNISLAAQLLKQAAEELGGLYTNARQVRVSEPWKTRTLADFYADPDVPRVTREMTVKEAAEAYQRSLEANPFPN